MIVTIFYENPTLGTPLLAPALEIPTVPAPQYPDAGDRLLPQSLPRP